MVHSRVRRAAALTACAAFLQAASAAAQTSSGRIQGTLVDPAGAAVAGARITVTRLDRGASRVTVTDSRGFFTTPGLPPGEYELVAEQQGYATLRQSGADVHAGQTLTLRLELRAAPAPETITLAGTPPSIERAQAGVSEVVEQAAIANLPARRRNALDLAVLAPGVTRNVLTGEMNFTALPGTLTRVVVDGVDAIGREFPQDMVQELVVTPGAAPAEYGNAGAAVQIVTRSGTNRLTGSIYEFFGDQSLNATTRLDDELGRPEASYASHQFGGAAGGPLVKDGHFFFAAYDGVRAHEGERSLDHDVFSVRSDHELADVGRVTLRYGHQDVATGRTRAFNTAFASSLGSALFNEVRFQYGTGRASDESLTLADATLDRIQIADTLSWTLGAHLVEGGLDVLLDDVSASVFTPAIPSLDEYAFFVQDEWRASEALTLSAGIRYDLQTFEDLTGEETDTDNVGPRVGAAWAPAGRRYVVRGGYGLFYGRTPGARLQQGHAGVEWEWMPHTTFAVNTLVARGEGLPDFGTLQFVSDYNAVSIGIGRRFAQNHAYTLSYTFGEADITSPDPGTFQRFLGSVVYSTGGLADRFDGLVQTVLEDWMLSAIYSAQTGPPAWNALDARVARELEVPAGLRLTLIWEAFNVLNRANGEPIGTRRISGPNSPRVMQIAVRLAF